MEMNPFYITPETIMNRLARVHNKKMIQIADVIEWAAECTTEYIEDFNSFVRYDDIVIEADDKGRFYLPCLVYRILDVHKSSSPVPYKKRGGFIELDDKSITTALLDYVGIPVTDSGELLIDKNHAQAVEAFIVHNLYYQDYLTGQIHPNMWQEILMKKENELLAARSSFRHWDQRKFETMAAIRGNIVPEIAKVPLFRMYNTSGK